MPELQTAPADNKIQFTRTSACRLFMLFFFLLILSQILVTCDFEAWSRSPPLRFAAPLDGLSRIDLIIHEKYYRPSHQSFCKFTRETRSSDYDMMAIAERVA